MTVNESCDTVTTRIRNRNQASGKRQINHDPRIPATSCKMSGICWICSSWRKDKTAILFEGVSFTIAHVEQQLLGPLQYLCPHWLECLKVLAKNRMVLVQHLLQSPLRNYGDFFVRLYETWHQRETFCQRQRGETKNTEDLEKFQKCFLQWISVGTSVWNQEANTSKKIILLICKKTNIFKTYWRKIFSHCTSFTSLINIY